MTVRTALHRLDRSRPVGPNQGFAPSRAPEHPGIACLVVVFCLYACLAWRAWAREVRVGPLNWYTSVLWSLPILSSSLGLAGVLRQRRRRVATATRESPERVDDLLIVVVPTVARFDNLVALERVVRSFLRQLPERFSHVRVDVVIEEGCPGSDEVARLAGHPGVRVITVPRRYSTARGTRFKARANHYAHELRAEDGEAKDDVWVLHMDDDTAVGPDTAVALAGFINRQAAAGADARHLAQGVLAFPRELAASRVLWLADAVRPGCDLSLFAATTGRGSPRIGSSR